MALVCIAGSVAVGCRLSLDHADTTIEIPPGELPCDVAAVLCERCVGCHAFTPRLGAHFPLRTWANVDSQFGTTGTRIWQRMQMVIEPGVLPHMPPLTSPTGQPTLGQYDTLRVWFASGAIPADVGSGCDDCVGVPDAGMPDAGSSD